MRSVFVALSAVLLLTACGVGDSPSGAGLDKAAPAGTRPLGDASMQAKTLRPSPSSSLVVTGVRVGSHAGFDRVVFDLSGTGSPGWFVDYTDNPSQLGSGRTIDVQGSTALNVNIDGTVSAHQAGVAPAQLDHTEGIGNVVEVVSAGTFEGRSQFVIGLTTSMPYSVEVLQEPLRLVIDFRQTP
ncbi:AMIN-like domain-containing (lipo)protein [Corynebacterium tapiri]|uniref:AMIN-like domain-containing protein n=1 Tax=Corynebacterium tapiri TaxID=1448266 RepID=A0A5C4U5F6_9CORY|nr:hypothetical protein [Corynebacterium tapiri]TNL98490.1 hypothetical protein FHE74_04630 [Corynebacterium tapiri]